MLHSQDVSSIARTFWKCICPCLMSPCSMDEDEAVNGLRVLGIDLEGPTRVADGQQASTFLRKIRKRYRRPQDP